MLSACESSELKEGNATPECAISAPAPDTVFSADEGITFEGTATDEDGENTWLTVSWTSSIDDVFQTMRPEASGELSFVATTLSPATHEITLSAMDEQGATCTDAISITVTDANTAP